MGFEEAVSEALQRRTAEHAKATPTKEAAPMSNAPAINRPLDPSERSLLGFLAARCVAEQFGCSVDEAFDALSRAAGEGRVILTGDNTDVRILLDGRGLVHCTREWLAFRASWPGEDPWRDQRWLT